MQRGATKRVKNNEMEQNFAIVCPKVSEKCPCNICGHLVNNVYSEKINLVIVCDDCSKIKGPFTLKLITNTGKESHIHFNALCKYKWACDNTEIFSGQIAVKKGSHVVVKPDDLLHGGLEIILYPKGSKLPDAKEVVRKLPLLSPCVEWDESLLNALVNFALGYFNYVAKNSTHEFDPKDVYIEKGKLYVGKFSKITNDARENIKRFVEILSQCKNLPDVAREHVCGLLVDINKQMKKKV